MANPFLGEIRIFPFAFAPKGWAVCNGQLLSISQNTALFSILGTQYGGDGRVTFALPNFQGAAPVHAGSSAGPGLSPYTTGQTGGEATVTLIASQMPAHTHSAMAAGDAGSGGPYNNTWGSGGRGRPPAYGPSSGTNVVMASSAVGITGGNQPHNNLAPYLTMNFCIALQGIFPPRS